MIKDHQSYLYGLDACSEKVWSQYGVLLHHATESDGAGGWWIPGYVEPSGVERVGAGFTDDSLVRLGPRGEILWQKSLTQILLDHGMEHALFTAGDYQDDPIHLNDIEPVLEDGPYWKKGDLFLWLRHLSLVVLYRPSEGRLVWSRQGPWMAQHDVDVLDDHRIAVFSNNAYNAGYGDYVRGSNEVLVYDFATGEVTSPWRDALLALGVKTRSEGLAEVTPAGNLVIEDENNGRLLILGPDGQLLASYLNRAGDGSIFTMGWSRIVAPALAESALAAVSARGGCGG